MIPVTIKKRSVIQRRLVRVNATPERRKTFYDTTTESLHTLPILGAISTAIVLAGWASFTGFQEDRARERMQRITAAEEQRRAIVDRMYESVNDRVKAQVARLYEAVKADGITDEELLQFQDALKVAGRSEAASARAPTPASQAELLQVIQWLSSGDDAVRERAREALTDQVLDSEEFVAIKALRDKR